MTHPDVFVKRPGSGRPSYYLALVALLGCGHTEPFDTPSWGNDQPFDPTPPVRLTLNRGPDRRAAWLPDGSAILYSAQLFERRDNDVCLALLPPSGGRLLNLTCNLSASGDNLTEALESPTPASDGRLAFVAATSAIGALTPDNQGIALATIDDPATRQMLRPLPYTIPGGRFHGGASQIRWLAPDRLLYLGESVTTLRPCPFCQLDTLRSGLDATLLSVAVPGTFPETVPGTDFASGVSPGGSEDEIYYTIGGDTRVYRRLLSTGDVSVAFDFGAAGIARDVHVVGSRMAAVVGGRVTFATDPSLGPTQWDSGGVLHVVNLQDGSDMTLNGPGLFRRPQLSPSGAGIVAEVYPLIITVNPVDGTRDTMVSRVGDLFLLGQP